MAEDLGLGIDLYQPFRDFEGVPPEQFARNLDRLQALNILYDRAGTGGFLHAYSPTFEGRFFFEFVQRIGGYDRYGEPNAPFRLAAQQRVRQA